MAVNETNQSVCSCCGQKRPFPTQAGLWEYVQDPLFNPDGTLLSEFRSSGTTYKGDKLDEPVTVEHVSAYHQPWQRVSIVDVRHLGGEYGLLLVPLGKQRAIWWPERAVWRKVGESPEIDWKEVICEGTRLGDGKWMGKFDEEDE